MINWRIMAVAVIMILCLIDISLTYYYVYQYKKWQPEKPYKLIELNPLLVFLWNHFGLHLGMFIGAVILLALNYLVSKTAHPIVVVLLLGFLIFAAFNHERNINLLYQLIQQYPTGHLPTEVFGKVVGNN